MCAYRSPSSAETKLKSELPILQVLGDMYLELPDRIRDASKLWAARKRQGDTLPRHVPEPEQRASEHLKHLEIKSAIKTHQIGVL